jgi:hypothetical protein
MARETCPVKLMMTSSPAPDSESSVYQRVAVIVPGALHPCLQADLAPRRLERRDLGASDLCGEASRIPANREAILAISLAKERRPSALVAPVMQQPGHTEQGPSRGLRQRFNRPRKGVRFKGFHGKIVIVIDEAPTPSKS